MGGGQQKLRKLRTVEAAQRVMFCSVVCLHCRAEAEAWMLENPPEAYRAKPWPALQSAAAAARPAPPLISHVLSRNRYVTDLQNNINERLGLQVKAYFACDKNDRLR